MFTCEFPHSSKNGDATLPFLVFLLHFQGRAIVFAKRKIPALQSRQGAFVDKDSSNHNAKWKLATEARLATDITPALAPQEKSKLPQLDNGVVKLECLMTPASYAK
jgi:hypothetical protein